jgi:hypothetical protein
MRSFIGRAVPLDSLGMANALSILDAEAMRVWSVLGVETSGCGFRPDRRPKMLFERHIFSRETGGRFDRAHPDISNPSPGGYQRGGPDQYARLDRAMALDAQAALRSASWGVGQVMGFNACAAGFADAGKMIDAMMQSENAQIEGMARFIASKGLSNALRIGDWQQFALGYNGKDYWKQGYQLLLAEEESRLKRDGLPDLRIRAAQTYLTFLGFDPHGIDGRIGDNTRMAMNRFQYEQELPVTRDLDAATYDALQVAVRAAQGA